MDSAYLYFVIPPVAALILAFVGGWAVKRSGAKLDRLGERERRVREAIERGETPAPDDIGTVASWTRFEATGRERAGRRTPREGRLPAEPVREA